jgi:DNA-directed RNA polymerase
MSQKQVDDGSLAAVLLETLVSRDDPGLSALAARIKELRSPGGGVGRPRAWIDETLRWSDRELAAAIMWHVLRSQLWTAEEEEKDSPLLSTVSTAIGADLLARYNPETREYDIDPKAIAKDLPMKVGGALLWIAENDVRLIDTTPAPGRSDYRVTLADPSREQLQRLIDNAKTHVRSFVTTTPPTTTVKVRKKPSMREERPTPPLRVVMAANKVQSTPWRINRRVLEALENEQTQGTVDEQIANSIGFGEYLTRRVVLAEARELANEERFYWRGFLEFRGRFYQKSGLLNYTSGDDAARGLLEFANGEKLDLNSVGFGWLAWHAAQMWGHGEEKTVPFGYGIPWLAKMGGEMDFADDDYTSWIPQAVCRCVERWQEADEPAQFLASVLALEDACAGRLVHLPVRVDATCSGMQHLALLTRDKTVGQLVNLWGPASLSEMSLVADDPNPDFYDQVAASVTGLTKGKERRETKAVLVPFFYGAGDRRRKTLSWKLAKERRGLDARIREQDTHDVKSIMAAAKKLAPREFAVLEWFSKVASAHNRTGPEGTPARWSSPSGFEVVQDYRLKLTDREQLRRWPGRRVEILCHTTTFDGYRSSKRRNLVKAIYLDKLDTRQQATAMKANVVHSLDAALLVELVIGSDIDHWAVAHDAFGVPPSRVCDLLQANKAAIRALYTADRLAEWTAAWREGGVDVPDPPEHEAELPREMWSDRRTLS